MTPPLTTQREVREAFWQTHPEFQAERRARKRQNDYRVDIRVAFCEYVEWLRLGDEISEALAERVTL
jgi:hypothetical protein